MDDNEKYTQYLGENIDVLIDRPMGSHHPTLGVRCEVNCGVLPGVMADDDSDVDVYVLQESKPLSRHQGLCVAVILRHDNQEHKLVVARTRMAEADILEAISFAEDHYDIELLLLR